MTTTVKNHVIPTKVLYQVRNVRDLPKKTVSGILNCTSNTPRMKPSNQFCCDFVHMVGSFCPNLIGSSQMGKSQRKFIRPARLGYPETGFLKAAIGFLTCP